jgi:hypothetical protein
VYICEGVCLCNVHVVLVEVLYIIARMSELVEILNKGKKNIFIATYSP